MLAESIMNDLWCLSFWDFCPCQSYPNNGYKPFLQAGFHSPLARKPHGTSCLAASLPPTCLVRRCWWNTMPKAFQTSFGNLLCGEDRVMAAAKHGHLFFSGSFSENSFWFSWHARSQLSHHVVVTATGTALADWGTASPPRSSAPGPVLPWPTLLLGGADTPLCSHSGSSFAGTDTLASGPLSFSKDRYPEAHAFSYNQEPLSFTLYSPPWTGVQPPSLVHDGSLEPREGRWELKAEIKEGTGQVEPNHQESWKESLSVNVSWGQARKTGTVDCG